MTEKNMTAGPASRQNSGLRIRKCEGEKFHCLLHFFCVPWASASLHAKCDDSKRKGSEEGGSVSNIIRVACLPCHTQRIFNKGKIRRQRVYGYGLAKEAFSCLFISFSCFQSCFPSFCNVCLPTYFSPLVNIFSLHRLMRKGIFVRTILIHD